MSNAPSSLSPRQRMINMMYLVLTALLALNVSKEVLNAFHSVNYGLKSTNESTIVTNQQVYTQFEDIALRNPEKNGPWKDRAFAVKSNINDLQSLIKEIKFELIKDADQKIHFIGEVDAENKSKEFEIKDVSYADFIKQHPHLINKKIGFEKDGKIKVVQNEKNTSIAWNLLRDDKPESVEYVLGPKLKDNIDGLKAILLSEKQDYNNNKDGVQILLEDKSLRQEIAKILSTKISGVKSKKFGSGKADSTWLATKFRAMPVIAAFTMLTQLESDLLKIESDIIKHLLKTINVGAIVTSGGQAMVMPKSDYVFKGDNYSADIFFGIKDKYKNPTVFITDDKSNVKDNGDNTYTCVGCDSVPIVGGVARYNVETKRIGTYEYSGLLKISGDDNDRYFPFGPKEYRVAKKSVVVSPTRMNTMYVLTTKSKIKSGKIDDKDGNPIEVSAAGFAPEDLSIQCYRMKKVDGKYKINTSEKITYKKKGKGKFIVYPTRTGRAVIIVRGKDENGKSVKQDQKEFIVRPAPPSSVVLGGTTAKDPKKIQKKNALSSVAVLKSSLPASFPFKGLKSRVVGFTFETTGGQLKEKVDVRGANLSRGKNGQDQVAKYIDAMSSGDEFILTNIKVKGPDGKEVRWAGDLKYTIAR